MVILLRLLLVILPVIMLLFWVRWRMKSAANGEVPESETKAMRRGLIVALISMVGIGASLKLLEDDAVTDGVYVPARVENGKVIPGHMAPRPEKGAETGAAPASEDN